MVQVLILIGIVIAVLVLITLFKAIKIIAEEWEIAVNNGISGRFIMNSVERIGENGGHVLSAVLMMLVAVLVFPFLEIRLWFKLNKSQIPAIDSKVQHQPTSFEGKNDDTISSSTYLQNTIDINGVIYKSATIIQRVSAYLIDSILVLLFFIFLPDFDFAKIVISVLYLVCKDALPSFSLGKNFLGLKILNAGWDGKRPNVSNLILRNLTLLIPFMAWIELLILMKDEQFLKQRLGDKWAQTVVVKKVSK